LFVNYDIIAEHEKCVVFIKNKLLILHNAPRQKLPESSKHCLGWELNRTNQLSLGTSEMC